MCYKAGLVRDKPRPLCGSKIKIIEGLVTVYLFYLSRFTAVLLQGICSLETKERRLLVGASFFLQMKSTALSDTLCG